MSNEQNGISVADEIVKLKALLDENIITLDEFNVAKSKLLGGEISPPPQEQNQPSYDEANTNQIDDTVYQNLIDSHNNENINQPIKPKKSKGFLIFFIIMGVFFTAVIVGIILNNRKEEPAPTPTPPPVVATPTPTPEPTPDPNAITDYDYVDLWLSRGRDFLLDSRVRITAFVEDNQIEVFTDGEVLGYIRLRQPIEFIELIDEEEKDEEPENEVNEDNDTDNDDNDITDEEPEPMVISGMYVTIIGRLSNTPLIDEELPDDIEFLFLYEVIAEVATEEEIEQIYLREEERIATRVAREEREAAAAEEAERLKAERLEEEARKEQERIDRRRDFIAECNSINYDLFYATPDDYIKNRIQVTATVLEIFERGDVHNEAGFHVTENRREQKEWYVTIFMMSDDSSTISVGDTIRFYGTFEGVERFPHRTDGHVYLPTMNAWYFNNR